MHDSVVMLRRDVISLCFFSCLPFAGLWSTIVYHKIETIGTNTIALLLDTFLTVMALCLCSSVFTGIMIKRTYRGLRPPSIRKDENFWRLFPQSPWAMGFITGVYAFVALSMAFDITYGAFNWAEITLTQFVLVKMSYSGVLGALISFMTIQKIMPGESASDRI